MAISPSSSSVSDHPINSHSIAALVILLVANLLVVHPLAIPLPLALSDFLRRAAYQLRITSSPTGGNATDVARLTGDSTRSSSSGVAGGGGGPAAGGQKPASRLRVRLGLVSAPLGGVLILLASKTIGGETVAKGIAGDPDGLKPYDIMLLFICLAYIAVSLDATGLLRFFAFLVSQKGGRSGPVLYAALYSFFFVFGALMGNDAIILSGTGFLVYFTKVTGVVPGAWIFAQFTVCNIASAVLVSSNITNLVITSTFGINFLTYTAWMILPSLATALIAFVFLLLVEFRPSIPRVLDQVDVNPREALVDLEGAIWGGCVFLGAIVALVAGSAVDVLGGVWEVTVPAALLVLVRDVWYDLRQDARTRAPIQPANGPSTPTTTTEAAPEGQAGIEMSTLTSSGTPSSSTAPSMTTSVAPLRPTSLRQVSARLPMTRPPSVKEQVGKEDEDKRVSLASLVRAIRRKFVTVSYVCERLPFNLLPFSFCMFILVEAVAALGWTRVFAAWWQAWVGVSGLVGCCFGINVVGVLLCNVIGTNIGCTIFITSILSTWHTLYAPSERQMTACLYTLAMAVNIGAFGFTFPASLAGLLWRELLKQKGVIVREREFLRRNWRVLIVCVVVSSAVILGEVAVILPA